MIWNGIIIIIWISDTIVIISGIKVYNANCDIVNEMMKPFTSISNFGENDFFILFEDIWFVLAYD